MCFFVLLYIVKITRRLVLLRLALFQLLTRKTDVIEYFFLLIDPCKQPQV